MHSRIRSKPLIAMLLLLCLVLPAPLLAARGATPQEPEPPALPGQDDIARVERIDESTHEREAPPPTEGPREDDAQDTGNITRSHCALELYGECFLYVTETWRNQSIDRQNSSSWSWSESGSERTGHRAVLLDGIAFAEVTTGSSSSRNASGADAHEHRWTSTFYENSFGSSEEHLRERRLDSEEDRAAEESVRTLHARAGVDTPLEASADATRERNGTRSSHESREFDASNHTYDAYFGLPVSETSDSSRRHSHDESAEAWNRTRVTVDAALNAGTTRVPLAHASVDRGDENSSSSGWWDDRDAAYDATFGIPLTDEAREDAGTYSTSRWAAWTSFVVDLGDGLLRATGSYRRGESTESSTHDASERSGSFGIGMERNVHESGRAEHSWRNADADVRAVDGSTGANVSYWDTEDTSHHESHEESAVAGTPFAGRGDSTDSYSRSRGFRADASLPAGILDVQVRHENTTLNDANSTNQSLAGEERFESTELHERSYRRTSLDARSAATGSSASAYHENGTSRRGDVVEVFGTPAGSTESTDGTRYGAQARILHGAASPAIHYEDERTVRRSFVGGESGAIDNEHEEFRSGVDGRLLLPDGTELVAYDAGHRETSDDATIGGDPGPGTRVVRNETSSGGTFAAFDHMFHLHASRTAQSFAEHTHQSEVVDVTTSSVEGGVLIDGRRVGSVFAPIDAALAPVAAADPVRAALAQAVAIAIVPAGSTVGIVGVEASGDTLYAERNDRADFASGQATVCTTQSVVAAPTAPTVPHDVDGVELPGAPLVNSVVTTAFGAPALLLCTNGVPVFVPLVLLSPAIHYSFARSIAFAILRSPAPPADAGVADLVEAIAGALAPYVEDPEAVMAAYEMAFQELRNGAVGAEDAYDGHAPFLGATYADAIAAAENEFDGAERQLDEWTGVDLADTWATIPSQARDPQPIIWSLHAATRQAEDTILPAWSALDLAIAALSTWLDANGSPERDVENPETIPDLPSGP